MSGLVKPDFIYTTGGTLAPDAPSYVERSADRELLSHLESGETCYVLNSRQMGKSSLCVRTIGKLKEQGIRTVFCDLTKFGGRNLTAEQWYAALLSEVGRDLGLRSEFLAYWKDNANLPPVQRLFGALVEVGLKDGRPVVVFVDEIDVTLSLPFSADEFFAAIRQCYVGRATDEKLKRLSFCLLGTATPADLIQDTRVSPFNIGKRIELQDFTEAEAMPLAAGLGDAGLLKRVLHWTGGHPYLTQRLCQAVCDSESKDVDRVCSDLFLTHAAKDSDDNLAFVRNRLLKSEADLAALLDLYRKMRAGKTVADDETNPLCALLKLSGVAKVEGGHLKVRNRIYEHVFDHDWVETHMPDAEKRRQKEAYRKGLVRAFALGGMVVLGFAVMSALALTNAAQSQKARIAATKERQRADRLLYEAQMRLVQQGWETDSIGQMLELLESTKSSPFKGFEWYYWQRQMHPQNLVRTLKGHTNYVHMAVVSPNGKYIASGSGDRTARLWDFKTGKEIRAFTGHENTVNAVSFSPDGTRLATCSTDLTTKIWDVANGRIVMTLRGHSRSVMNLAYSPDGRILATVSADRTTVLWEAKSGRAIRRLGEHSKKVQNLGFSSDGQRLATCSDDGTTVIWDVQSGRKVMTLRGHIAEVNHVLFSNDGSRIFTGASDRTVRVWDARTGEIEHTLPQSDIVFGLALSSDGRKLAVCCGAVISLYDAFTYSSIWTTKGHKRTIGSVKFAPDDRHVVTSSTDLTIKVWRANYIPKSSVVKKFTGFALSITLSPDEKTLACAEDDNSVSVLDIATGAVQLKLKDHNREVLQVKFSPDGRRIATASLDGTAKVWDSESGKLEITLNGHKSDVNSVAFSPDSKLLATASLDRTAKLWDLKTGREIHTLAGHSDGVYAVAWSPDGSRIATGAADNSVKVWKVLSGQLVSTFSGHKRVVYALAYSKNGKRIVTGSEDGTAIVWDANVGSPLFTLNNYSDVMCVAFSPDGRRVATGAKTLMLWDAETGGQVGALNGHSDWVSSIAYSRDGRRIFTSSWDMTVRVWEAATPEQVETWEREEQQGVSK